MDRAQNRSGLVFIFMILRVVYVCNYCTSITLITIVHGFPTTLRVAPVKRSSTVICSKNQFCDDTQTSRRELFNRIASASILISTATIGSYSNFYSNALSPQDVSTQYDNYATSYDELDGGVASTILGIDDARKDLITQARGKVLEIGVGTGLNLPYYVGNDRITSLDFVDISSGMLQQAKNKASVLHNLPDKINFVKADITSQLVQLYGYETFDTVIDTFSMCVLGNKGTQQCLDQISSIVRASNNGGQILLLENSRSSNILLGSYQDMTANLIADTSFGGGKGCYYNQNIRQLIQSNSKLRIVEEKDFATGLFRSFRCVRNT